MYDPVKDAVDKSVQAVTYTEVAAPDSLAELVHCFWEMKTETELDDDFVLHALPDACVNVLLDQHDTRIAGVTALHTTHTTLNLGRSFHYVGVQFYPGVWRGAPEGTVDHYVGEPYDGALPLVETSRAIVKLDLDEKAPILSQFVDELRSDGVVAANPVTAAILRNIGDILSVADMANVAGLSPRHLQRKLKATTGFSPHDLLKVLRLQHSFRQDYLLAFADQSHFIHSFRDITGYTPAQFQKIFDV
ncbi:MAG: AraC family transcriptional regulator [Acidimicrobiia bacterium]|nr:AraC family transcriptional regulator [Acidimicrobiia bacterium]